MNDERPWPRKKKNGTFAVTYVNFEHAISHVYVTRMVRRMALEFYAHVIHVCHAYLSRFDPKSVVMRMSHLPVD